MELCAPQTPGERVGWEMERPRTCIYQNNMEFIFRRRKKIHCSNLIPFFCTDKFYRLLFSQPKSIYQKKRKTSAVCGVFFAYPLNNIPFLFDGHLKFFFPSSVIIIKNTLLLWCCSVGFNQISFMNPRKSEITFPFIHFQNQAFSHTPCVWVFSSSSTKQILRTTMGFSTFYNIFNTHKKKTKFCPRFFFITFCLLEEIQTTELSEMNFILFLYSSDRITL